MSGSNEVPAAQSLNLIGMIESDLNRYIEEYELGSDRAFLELCVDYLGYKSDSDKIVDGKDDFGFDYIDVGPSSTTIFQTKSVEYTGKLDRDIDAGTDKVTDLPRIRSILSNLDDLPPSMKYALRSHLGEIKSYIVSSSGSDGKSSADYQVTVYFCFMGRGFTASAEAEFKNLDISPISYGGRRISLVYIPVFLGELISQKWSELNTKWANKNNEKRDVFEFSAKGEAIRDGGSAVFFTNTDALVYAYREIGYQLFESNVRCEIKNSSVNRAIKSSIKSFRGRREFKHLNNGVTVVCENFQIKKIDGNQVFRVIRPGVINGLQTIKSVSDTIKELSAAELADFNKNCEILVRLHTQNAVSDYKDLVKSTNNQNPMKPRNLRSNDGEQIVFERLFSDLGWFYERKEGAWNAFNGDSKSWSTLPNRRPVDFKSGSITRKVDNEEIAQSWLSFIGFSEQAVDQKRFIFERDDLYDLAFRLRTVKHGADYGFSVSAAAASTESVHSSPNPKGLLLAFVFREFAKAVVPSRKENRDSAIKRLDAEKLPKRDQDNILSQDFNYLKEIIVRGMLLLFVEFSGLIMFRSFGGKVHDRFDDILSNRSIQHIKMTGDLVKPVTDYKEQRYQDDDILLVLWELYNHCVLQLVSTGWRQQWEQAPNRSKFIYADTTRKPLINQIDEAERLFSRQNLLVRIWSTKINEAQSLYKFIDKITKK